MEVAEQVGFKDIINLLNTAISSIDELEPCLYGKEDRPKDWMDCGVVDGSWDTWCYVLDCLEIDKENIDLLLSETKENLYRFNPPVLIENKEATLEDKIANAEAKTIKGDNKVPYHKGQQL